MKLGKYGRSTPYYGIPNYLLGHRRGPIRYERSRYKVRSNITKKLGAYYKRKREYPARVAQFKKQLLKPGLRRWANRARATVAARNRVSIARYARVRKMNKKKGIVGFPYSPPRSIRYKRRS